MFPLAHMYCAEAHFGKLTNKIKLATTLPDFILLLPFFSINDTHTLLHKFDDQDFKAAWNLHILLDDYSEKNYFYHLTPKTLKQKVGAYVGHIFIETALDFIMLEDNIYFSPPRFDKSLIIKLEKYLNKNLLFLHPSMKLFVKWDRGAYIDHLAYSLMYQAGTQHCVFTREQVIKLIDSLKPLLPDYQDLLSKFMENIKDKI